MYTLGVGKLQSSCVKAFGNNTVTISQLQSVIRKTTGHCEVATLAFPLWQIVFLRKHHFMARSARFSPARAMKGHRSIPVLRYPVNTRPSACQFMKWSWI